ncbi:hypothetical protein EST38_g10071 [Candolleomyces aberdarensis]|uniref:Nephrocystin 3-like N-terminal domain-containing protein n=1 Tax=Candolleomyces aberdarensis TaxID=2316362 RepID=A0A4Q2DAI5_9AGAR|nr:hypothetical protein EST38_g10071 [Candolleomyces aberdarensis]
MDYGACISMFSNAQGFKVGKISVHSNQHVQNAQGNRIDGWKMLLENIASNALHDSNARFDPPKCDEDTRVEVTHELMDWIQDREGPQRLLCMTGAAGAGKSALQQTIAERCSDSNILGSAFFFSAGDPTRNNLTHIVPTIAYQLGLRQSALRDTIVKTIENDPVIFKKNLKMQMDTLVVAPFKQLCARGELHRDTFPHAILIDGLDECSGEENQAELLSTIKHCLLDNDLPFRIFIASRPEWAVRSALDSEPEGYLHQLAYHINLSDMYDATSDIRRYLWGRLRGIGSRSYDRQARSHLWPTAEDIEKLVEAASGQFIYAATVVKYLSERRSSPVDRLRTIINWTPDGGQQARPFEALDLLYRNILSTAKELYEAVDTNRGQDFLFLIRAHELNAQDSLPFGSTASCFDEFMDIIGFQEGGGHQVLFSDLHSLVFFEQIPLDNNKSWEQISFYHRSFSEFLDNEIRAQHLFVSETRVLETVTNSCLQKLLQRKDFLGTKLDTLDYIAVQLVLNSFCRIIYVDDLQLIEFTRNNGWERIDEILPSPLRMKPMQRHGLACFTADAIERLNNELHEHELANIVKSYFDKWEEKYRGRGFKIEFDSSCC